MIRTFVRVVVVGALLGLGVRFFVNARYQLASAINASDPNYERVICGPTSLSLALGRIGISVAPAEIAEHCRVTSYGVSLADLQRYCSRRSLVQCASKDVNWNELLAVKGVAVLFVKGEHYVAADPRESTTSDSIRIYDGDAPARWWPRAELEKMWTGRALLITKRSSALAMDQPRIEWDECYIDKGVLPNTEMTSYRFGFCNQGRATLQIQNIQTSCGCTKPTLSHERIAPGESGYIDVSLNLAGREGVVRQTLVIDTNDPVSQSSILRVSCAVPRKRSVSAQAIRFEDIPQGGSADQEFVVADPGFGNIKLREAKFSYTGDQRSNDNLLCTISWTRLEAATKALGSRLGFPVSPGDFLVKVAFTSQRICPVGPFYGKVIVTLECDDEIVTHQVDIQGAIVQDIYSVPQIALITLGPDLTCSANANIRLCSRTNRKVTVIDASLDNARLFSIYPTDAPIVNEQNYLVSACMPDLLPGDTPYGGKAVFELDDKSHISVPIIVSRPPLKHE